MPNIYNFYHKDAPKTAIFIGRGTSYGNPFQIGRDGDRDAVCDNYEKYVENNPALKKKIKENLKGKDLVCFCKPKRCHGDYLLKLANEERL